jgi:alpha-L-arabinofuranosidase
VTLVHTHATDPAEVVIRLRGGAARQVRQTVLSHAELNAHNNFERPDNLVPKMTELTARGPEFNCVLPPASVSRLDIALG